MKIDRYSVNLVLLLSLLLIIFLAGCGIPAPMEATLLPQATLTATTEPVISTEELVQPADEPVTLKIWVPPEFDPTNGSPEGELLAKRLEEFVNRKSNVRIETRAKAIEGPGGILDMLTTANAAAPLALPDLVALPQHDLETAAIKGLLRPFDGLTKTMEDPDWYEFAQQLSHLQNSSFGIPFAGDALIMVYRPSVLGEQPEDWASLLELSTQTSASLSFPASNSYSLLTLTFYQSIGGSLLDEENRPTLNSIQLTEVMTYYQQAQQSMLMPFWLTQNETDDQSWGAYEENEIEMVITWAHRYLLNPPVDSLGAPIPTRDGIPFTLGTGWSWALVGQDPDRQALSAQLAEFITNAEFLGEWTSAAGFIPPRSSSTSSWENVSMRTLLNQVAPSVRLLPSLDVLTTLGPILKNATVVVLKQESSPVSAVETAIEALSTP